MKATCKPSDLSAALKTLAPSLAKAGARNVMPILSGLRVVAREGEIVLHVTNLDVSDEASVPAVVEEPGACCPTDFRLLRDVARELDDSRAVTLATTTHRGNVQMQRVNREWVPVSELPDDDSAPADLFLTWGSSEFRFFTFALADWPAGVKPRSALPFSLDARKGPFPQPAFHLGEQPTFALARAVAKKSIVLADGCAFVRIVDLDAGQSVGAFRLEVDKFGKRRAVAVKGFDASSVQSPAEINAHEWAESLLPPKDQAPPMAAAEAAHACGACAFCNSTGWGGGKKYHCGRYVLPERGRVDLDAGMREGQCCAAWRESLDSIVSRPEPPAPVPVPKPTGAEREQERREKIGPPESDDWEDDPREECAVDLEPCGYGYEGLQISACDRS